MLIPNEQQQQPPEEASAYDPNGPLDGFSASTDSQDPAFMDDSNLCDDDEDDRDKPHDGINQSYDLKQKNLLTQQKSLRRRLQAQKRDLVSTYKSKILSNVSSSRMVIDDIKSSQLERLEGNLTKEGHYHKSSFGSNLLVDTHKDSIRSILFKNSIQSSQYDSEGHTRNDGAAADHLMQNSKTSQVTFEGSHHSSTHQADARERGNHGASDRLLIEMSSEARRAHQAHQVLDQELDRRDLSSRNCKVLDQQCPTLFDLEKELMENKKANQGEANQEIDFVATGRVNESTPHSSTSVNKAENQQEYLFALNRPSLGSQGMTGSFDNDSNHQAIETACKQGIRGDLPRSENKFQPNQNLISFGKKMSQGSALLLQSLENFQQQHPQQQTISRQDKMCKDFGTTSSQPLRNLLSFKSNDQMTSGSSLLKVTKRVMNLQGSLKSDDPLKLDLASRPSVDTNDVLQEYGLPAQANEEDDIVLQEERREQQLNQDLMNLKTSESKKEDALFAKAAMAVPTQETQTTMQGTLKRYAKIDLTSDGSPPNAYQTYHVKPEGGAPGKRNSGSDLFSMGQPSRNEKLTAAGSGQESDQQQFASFQHILSTDNEYDGLGSGSLIAPGGGQKVECRVSKHLQDFNKKLSLDSGRPLLFESICNKPRAERESMMKKLSGQQQPQPEKNEKRGFLSRVQSVDIGRQFVPLFDPKHVKSRQFNERQADRSGSHSRQDDLMSPRVLRRKSSERPPSLLTQMRQELRVGSGYCDAPSPLNKAAARKQSLATKRKSVAPAKMTKPEKGKEHLLKNYRDIRKKTASLVSKNMSSFKTVGSQSRFNPENKSPFLQQAEQEVAAAASGQTLVAKEPKSACLKKKAKKKSLHRRCLSGENLQYSSVEINNPRRSRQPTIIEEADQECTPADCKQGANRTSSLASSQQRLISKTRLAEVTKVTNLTNQGLAANKAASPSAKFSRRSASCKPASLKKQHPTDGIVDPMLAQDVGTFLHKIHGQIKDNRKLLIETKAVVTRQTQQILKLLEIQVKYNVNVLDPEDEISDFDLDKCLKLQNKLEKAAFKMQIQQLQIPECMDLFERKYDMVDREKLKDVNAKISNLKHKNDLLQQQLNVLKRNEKYKFLGHRAVQASNPYITCRKEKLNKNIVDLELDTYSAKYAAHRRTHSHQQKTQIKGLKQISSFTRHLSPQPPLLQRQSATNRSSSNLPNSSMLPSSQISNDLINPHSSLDARTINKINQRFREIKQKLFLKDKQIQDRIQQVNALTFFNECQASTFKQRMEEKDKIVYKVRRKFNQLKRQLKGHVDHLIKVHQDEKEQLVETMQAGAFGAMMKNKVTLEDVQKVLPPQEKATQPYPAAFFQIDEDDEDDVQSSESEEVKEAQDPKANGGHTNQNFLKVLEQNYSLLQENRELKGKISILKDFIMQNDQVYKFSELQTVFSKLGNIFKKNLDETPIRQDDFTPTSAKVGVSNSKILNTNNRVSVFPVGGQTSQGPSNPNSQVPSQHVSRLTLRNKDVSPAGGMNNASRYAKDVATNVLSPIRQFAVDKPEMSAKPQLIAENDKSALAVSEFKQNTVKAEMQSELEQIIQENMLYPEVISHPSNPTGEQPGNDDDDSASVFDDRIQMFNQPRGSTIANSVRKTPLSNLVVPPSVSKADEFHREKFLFGEITEKVNNEQPQHTASGLDRSGRNLIARPSAQLDKTEKCAVANELQKSMKKIQTFVAEEQRKLKEKNNDSNIFKDVSPVTSLARPLVGMDNLVREFPDLSAVQEASSQKKDCGGIQRVGDVSRTELKTIRALFR